MKAIQILLALVAVSALGVAATSLGYLLFSDGYVGFALYIALPQMFLLLVASISLRTHGDRAATGYWARRGLYVMLGILSLTIDLHLMITGLPMYAGALLTITTAFAIRVIEVGRLRYVVPLVAAAPLVVMAIADGMFRPYWIVLSAILLVYAGCMVYLQGVGIGAGRRDGDRPLLGPSS